MSTNPTRRQLLQVAALTPFVPSASFAAVDSPAGVIKTKGGLAVFSTDFPRPLESVVFTFANSYGWQVTYEEAPILYSGDMIDVTSETFLGPRAFIARGGVLEFSYELDPTGAPPENPRSALEAAVVAHHQAGLPGSYRIVEDQEFFHVIPTGHTSELGRNQPVRSPLDAVVTLDRGSWEPRLLFNELIGAVSEQSEYQIFEGPNPFWRGGIQPVIEGTFQRVTARSVLRYMIRSIGRRRVWYLLFHIRTRRYYLSVV